MQPIHAISILRSSRPASLAREQFPLLLCLIWFAVASITAPGFASLPNMESLLLALFPLLVVSLGQTLVLLVGGIDLSQPSGIALASVLGSLVATSGITTDAGVLSATGVLTMLATGAALGLFNGTAVAFLRMPAFMVTLATMMGASGLAIWTTQSRTVPNLPPQLIAIGSSTWISLLMVSGLALLTHLTLAHTILGRWIYALGQNRRVAEVSGVPVRMVTVFAFVASGLCAGFAAIIYTGRLQCGSPSHGQNILLDVIGASVIGGASLFGGKGKATGTIYGALFLTLLGNSLNLLNLSHFVIMMTKGLVILVAAGLDQARNQPSR